MPETLTIDQATRELIERFRAEVWNGASSVTAGEVINTCVAYSYEFLEWLDERGVPSSILHVGSPDELGYADRTSDAGGEGHTVVVLNGWRVDWTAAQYGYGEFPKITPA